MNAKKHISPEDLALHALGSLPEAESVLAAAHLAKCDECRLQLAEFTGDVGLIGLSLPQHPLPEGARQRFLDRIAQDAYSAKPAPEAKKAKVIAFPLAQNGRDLLMNAPSPVSEKQLRDVHLTIRKPVPKV